MGRIRIGVIPAAGEGKRLGYLSSIIPKSLFPLYGKPIIQYVIDNMVRNGVQKIIIPVHYQKSKLIEYFEHVEKDVNAEICIVEPKELPKGIALTIGSAETHLDEPFMVILGDDITIADSLQPLIDLFFEAKAVAVEGIVLERNQEIIKRACCVELKENKQISRIIEKPENPASSLRGCGVYILDPEILEYIEKTPPLPPRHEVEITNTISLVAEDGKAYGELIDGININVNTPEDLFQAWLAVRNGVTRDE